MVWHLYCRHESKCIKNRRKDNIKSCCCCCLPRKKGGLFHQGQSKRMTTKMGIIDNKKNNITIQVGGFFFLSLRVVFLLIPKFLTAVKKVRGTKHAVTSSCKLKVTHSNRFATNQIQLKNRQREQLV